MSARHEPQKSSRELGTLEIKVGLIRANVDIAEKSNELPAAQQLLDELQVAHCIITPDATHRLRPGSPSN
jgi:hypothetical protein